MSEHDPILELSNNGDKVYAHRHNTALFSFIGDQACYDHIFINNEDIDDVAGEADEEYLYLFKSHSMYEDVLKFITDNNFMQHLNLVEASEIDVEVFEMAHYRDIRSTEFPPKEWEKE